MRRLLLITTIPCLLLGLVLWWGTQSHEDQAERGAKSPAEASTSDGQASPRERAPADGGSSAARDGPADPTARRTDSTAGGDSGASAGVDAAAPGAAGGSGSGSDEAPPASSASAPPPALDDLSPAVRAQVLRLKQQGADPRLRTASDGSTFVELGGPALFVPVATVSEDGDIEITEY
jgi:hypothetical protein